MTRINQEWIKSIAKENPHLTFTHLMGEHQEEPDRIEVTGFPFNKQTTAFFYEQNALDILLTNLSKLTNVKFFGNQALVINEHQLFAILDVPYIESQSGPFIFKSEIPYEEYKSNHNAFSFHVGIGAFSPSVLETMEMTSQTGTVEEFIVKHQKNREEEILRKAWNNFLFSWLLGAIDRRPVLSNMLKGGDFLWRPYIIRDAGNILSIEVECDDPSAVQFLEERHSQIINSILLDYYQAHNLVAKILRVRTSFASIAELLPEIPEMSKDRKLTSRKLRSTSPELMNYLYAAESSDSQTFRFLSYYHIIEYFFNYVEHEDLRNEIGKILESSDLSERTDCYSLRLIQYLNESKRSHLHGDDKLQRVIKRYISFSTFPDTLPKDIKQAMNKSVKFDGGLKLQGVNTSGEEYFFGDLTRRIYSLRNALVHSTMEISEIKRSVSNTIDDKERMSAELGLIRQIAKEILDRSSRRNEMY